MKYIISESQYNMIVEQNQYQQPVSFVNFQRQSKSTKGLFQLTERNIWLGINKFTPNNKNPTLENYRRYEVSMKIKNISGKNAIVENVTTTASQNNRVSNIYFTEEPQPNGGDHLVSFLLENTQRHKSNAANSFTINVSFLVGNQRDTMAIDFSYFALGEESKSQRCKQSVNNTHLVKAVAWWKNWLNNTTTKAKFAKNHKYDINKVQEIFSKYNNILDNIKIKYVFKYDYPHRAYVDPSDGLTNGYNLPVTINCAFMETEKDPYSLMVHEVGHVLDFYHNLHPYNSFKNKKKPSPNKLTSLITGEDETKNLTDNLIKNGFSDYEAEYIAYTYMWRLENDEKHLSDYEEQLSALAQIRLALKLTPEKQITKEMLLNNASNGAVVHYIEQWIYSGLSLQDWLNQSNTIAMNLYSQQKYKV